MIEVHTSRGPMPDLLAVKDLTVEFGQGRRRPPLRAVDDVTLTIGEGETVGLVGESGSGKTTLGRAILGLTSVTRGTIEFDNRDITRARHAERRRLSTRLQAIFQDPYSSLNPSRRIGETLVEALPGRERRNHQLARARVREMLERVGLVGEVADRFPAQFSGGQRQRIAIARALMPRPKLIICDEPVSALDLSIQAQILNLLSELQQEQGVAYLFVAHDLSVVRHLSHKIVVLYRGQVMEEGPADVVHENPSHPYTRALLEAAPAPDPAEQRRRREIRHAGRQGPSLVGKRPTADGCPFAARCMHATEICVTTRPTHEHTSTGVQVACHHWRELGTLALDRAVGPSVAVTRSSMER